MAMDLTLSMDTAEQRRVESLLNLMCANGVQLVDEKNKVAAELLTKHGFASYIGDHVGPTTKGMRATSRRMIGRA